MYFFNKDLQPTKLLRWQNSASLELHRNKINITRRLIIGRMVGIVDDDKKRFICNLVDRRA